MIGRRVPGITLQNGPLKNSTRSRISLPIIKRRCLCPTVTHILKRRKLTSTPQMVVDERHHKVRVDTDWASTHPASTHPAGDHKGRPYYGRAGEPLHSHVA